MATPAPHEFKTVADQPVRLDGSHDTRATAAAELVHVGKRFGATSALSDVSVTVRAGTSHALVGRNGSGKSTLIGILTGILTPDTGQVRIYDQLAERIENRSNATTVACVYQRPKILADLTVTENLFLGENLARNGFIRWKDVNARATTLLEQWDVRVRPTTLARDLTVEQRQLVEIARALSRGRRLIILDEPTAQLDRRASGRLFAQMRRLQIAGVTFLLVSHHLHDVYDACQYISVLRDGRHVISASVTELPMAQLLSAMVGDAVAPELQAQTRVPESKALNTASLRDAATTARRNDKPVLRLDKLSLIGCYIDISLHVDAGEILVLTGLTSSGKTELADTIVGLRRATSGTVLFREHPLKPSRIDLAIAAGIGYVPEDRHARGFGPQLSIAENLTCSVTHRLGPFGFIRPNRRDRIARQLADRLEIVPNNIRVPVSDLSGGNQQKVVVGRALANSPSLLVLVRPTAGVDIASKHALYHLIEDVRRDGTAVLLVTDESDEIALGDRAVVMFDGHAAVEFHRPWHERELVAAIEGVAEQQHPLPSSQSWSKEQ